MTKHFCTICSSKKVSTINSHLFSSIRCKECFHETILVKEDGLQKFVAKTLKNNNIHPKTSSQIEDVIEYSYCPYWTTMKLFNKLLGIRIRKRTPNLLMIQSFSSKSLQIFADNLKVPYKITENNDFYYIDIQSSLSSP